MFPTLQDLKIAGVRIMQRENFPCQICGEEFASREALDAHEKSHHPETQQISVICPICGSEFANQARLDLHNTQHHPAKV
jgi:uncharacterized Zn-finger protein